MMKGMNTLLRESFVSCENYANFVAPGVFLGDAV
jgi:hypothetical protein